MSLVLVLLLLSFGSSSDESVVAEARSPEPLKQLARRQGLLIGTQITPARLLDDPDYERVLLREFDLIMPGNEFKMNHVAPRPNVYDFSSTDRVLDYAEKHGLEVHGHALVYIVPWYYGRKQWTRDELIEHMTGYIKTVVGRYQGRIRAWDVVNEAICTGNRRHKPQKCRTEPGSKAGMTINTWLDAIGPDYVEIALRAARDADPDVFLYINDNGMEFMGTPEGEYFYEFVRDLKARDVPLDGIGMQMHVPLDHVDFANLSAQKKRIADNFKRFNDLGLDVRITELDVAIPKRRGGPSAEQLEQQAQTFSMLLEVCLEAAQCSTFNIWGFSDRYSWIPGNKKGYDDATLMDREYRVKPAFASLRRTLSNAPAKP